MFYDININRLGNKCIPPDDQPTGVNYPDTAVFSSDRHGIFIVRFTTTVTLAASCRLGPQAAAKPVVYRAITHYLSTPCSHLCIVPYICIFLFLLPHCPFSRFLTNLTFVFLYSFIYIFEYRTKIEQSMSSPILPYL